MQSTTIYTAITYSALKGEPCTASQRLSISLHGRKGSGGTARCLFVSATSLFGLQVWQFVGECLGRRAVAEFPHGTVVNLVDDLLHVPRHVGG